MVAKIKKISDLDFEKVAYYTVQVEGREPEFSDFLRRMGKSEVTVKPLGSILTAVRDIGIKHGAKEQFFRHERNAFALPPKTVSIGPGMFGGLRLFCVRVSEHIVILLNGDVKTNGKTHICKNCKQHFELACKIDTQITNAIAKRELSHDGKELTWDEWFELNI